MPSPETPGFNPDEPKKRGIKVIKKLDIKIDDIRMVPPEEPFEETSESEKQSDMEWAEDLRAQVQLKKSEKLTEKDKAREDFKRLFKDE